MTAVRVNGIDLATRFGFYTERIGGWLGMATLQNPSVSVYGRAGAVALPARVPGGRVVEVSQTMRADSQDARRTAERGLADLLHSGLVRLQVEDGLSGPMQIAGRLQALLIAPFGPSLDPLASRATWSLVCDPEIYWRSQEPRTRALAAAATRYTLPLGTAPSSPILRVMGSATDPVLTYRDAGGAVVWTMGFTATLATTDYLDIDTRAGLIRRVNSGTATNGISLLTSGSFPRAFDPQDGDRTTAAWPTLEVSSGTAEALWWEQWL